MKILGILGSPRVKGKCARLLDKALEGAASTGAETKKFELIKRNITFCRDCGNCFRKDPELTMGKCPLKDEVSEMLAEYLTFDGYFFAAPCYDMFTTALMKGFLERKIMFTYKDVTDPATHGKFPTPRPGIPQDFKKKASFIVTANCGDELEEVMGEPCYEAFEAHLLFEEIDTVDKLYCGGVEGLTDALMEEKLKRAYDMGVNLVNKITAARQDG